MPSLPATSPDPKSPTRAVSHAIVCHVACVDVVFVIAYDGLYVL
jgi:hypothetical protein